MGKPVIDLVTVSRFHDDPTSSMCYCLRWTNKGDTYHVWLDGSLGNKSNELFKKVFTSSEARMVKLNAKGNNALFQHAVELASLRNLFAAADDEIASKAEQAATLKRHQQATRMRHQQAIRACEGELLGLQ